MGVGGTNMYIPNMKYNKKAKRPKTYQHRAPRSWGRRLNAHHVRQDTVAVEGAAAERIYLNLTNVDHVSCKRRWWKRRVGVRPVTRPLCGAEWLGRGLTLMLHSLIYFPSPLFFFHLLLLWTNIGAVRSFKLDAHVYSFIYSPDSDEERTMGREWGIRLPIYALKGLPLTTKESLVIQLYF